MTRRTVLPGGVRVVSELVPAVRSIVLGTWVGVGSRDEGPASHGASHFLEHLLFKGTERRTAFEISAAIEAVGGDLNAFTTKECTCFHARVLAEDMGLATDVLMDMITSARIDAADFDSERRVVLEELAMRDDEPGDFAHQAFSGAIYGQSPLARPIIGTVQSLENMRRSAVLRHYRRHYRPAALAVTAAGAVDHDELVGLVERASSGWREGSGTVPVAPRALRDRPRAARPSAAAVVRPRETEQAHLVLGMTGLPRTDPRRWPLAALDVALGGGMSSRLFQEVRERRGLAYAVGTFRAGHSDAGVFGVQAGTHPERAGETVSVIRGILREVAANGIGDEELERAKGQLRGARVLEAEDPGARMYRLGDAEILSGELDSIDEIIDLIDAVDANAVADVAAEVLGREQTLAVVGPFDSGTGFASAEGDQ